MRQKQVKVIGNCHAWAVARFYWQFVGSPNAENVSVVEDLGLSAAALRQAVDGADVVIVQERDFKHGITREDLGQDIEIFPFPMVVAGFLWPYANEPHVLNVADLPISDGPYPAQMGDRFLNRLIKNGVGPQEALDRYLALDIAREASLDRVMEIYLDRQRERDRATGFSIAPTIEADFRSKRLFLTAEHPDAPIFGVMIKQLFESMNVPSNVTDIALETLTRSPFPPTELPLHPGVIDHFGLTFAKPTDRYVYVDEGRFTFEEYVLRYMRYDNRPELREAIYMAGREDPSVTLRRLEPALAQTPCSLRGHRAKGEMLKLLGRLDEAEVAYREAIRIDPEQPDAYVELARMLYQAGVFDRAEEVALVAVGKEPHHGASYLVLAETLVYGGKVVDGLGPAREAARLLPGEGDSHRIHALALHGTGRLEEAERAVRKAIVIQPGEPNHTNLLAEIMEGQGRRSEALSTLEEGVSSGRKNDQTYSLLGNFLMRAGEWSRAEWAFSEGARLHGHHRPDLFDCMMQARQMQPGAASA